MSNLHKHAIVVLSHDNKSATVIGVNGERTTVVAHTTLGFWSRKDGGVTFRMDQNHRSQTVRLDRFGRVTSDTRVRFGQ